MVDNSLSHFLDNAQWRPLEIHINDLRVRIDSSIIKTQQMRNKYREELLSKNPKITEKILRPSKESLLKAEKLLTEGTVAAADGTLSPVPLLGGSKIQVGVVIVSNKGDVVNLLTEVFEAELAEESKSAQEFFSNLKKARNISNLLARAIMLFAERSKLFGHEADWRMIHGELIPHEIRTGAGNPAKNLKPAFDLINSYIESKKFIAVSEGSESIDLLNAAILLEQGEYIVVRSLKDDLLVFLNGDPETGQQQANFSGPDRERFRQFIDSAGPQVAEVLVKAGSKPFLIECHCDMIEEAVSLFLADSLWTKGFSSDGSDFTIRGFPFHIDLADQVARTLLKGSDYRNFVESRLFDLGIESGLFEIDPRRTRS
jgi:hypothetical protein